MRSIAADSSAKPLSRSCAADNPKPIAVPVKETCRLLGIGNTLAYELIASGRLKSITIGRRRLILFNSIESLVAEAAPSNAIATVLNPAS